MGKFVFPIIIMALSAGASIIFFFNGDWRRGLYWLFATGITAVVTF